ncbi:MAG: hypothetical protein LBR44_01825 [Clostridiales Family XIII bacterium]|jgi:hypothetical protein|nr:hypothetical protein [Clostridiales Family XIII bacterium]
MCAKKKTLLFFALALLLAGAVSLAGCGGKASGGSSAAAGGGSAAAEGGSVTADGGSGAAAGGDSTETPSDAEMPNPREEVDGPDAILTRLGIHLEADEAGSDQRYAIIGGTTAECSYSITYPDWSSSVTARAVKSAAFVDVSGDYTEYAQTKTVDVEGTEVTVKFDGDGGGGTATWYNKAAGISGSVSQNQEADENSLMELAEVFINQESKGL